MADGLLDGNGEAHARQRNIGLLLLVATSVLWSLAGLGVKTAGMHPLAFAMYRSLAACLVPLMMLPTVGGRRPHTGWMGLGIVLYACLVSLLIAAMTLGTAARGILLQYTAPAFCALLAWLFQGRRIGGRTILALLISGAGVLLMIVGAPPGGSPLGMLCGTGSGLAFAAMILVLEQIDRRAGGNANPMMIVLLNNAGTVLILLPVCAALGVLRVEPTQLGIVAATGVIQLGIPYILFQLALRRVSPVDASLLILLEPVLNPLWVALATDERPDAPTIIGGIAILAAMVIEATKRSAVSRPALAEVPA